MLLNNSGKKINMTFKSKNEVQSQGQSRPTAKLFAPPSSSNPVKAVPIEFQQPPPAVAVRCLHSLCHLHCDVRIPLCVCEREFPSFKKKQKSNDATVVMPSQDTETFSERPDERADKQNNDFFSDFAEAAPSTQGEGMANWNAFVSTDQNHPQTQPPSSTPEQQNGQGDWGDAFVSADTASKVREITRDSGIS